MQAGYGIIAIMGCISSPRNHVLVGLASV